MKQILELKNTIIAIKKIKKGFQQKTQSSRRKNK